MYRRCTDSGSLLRAQIQRLLLGKGFADDMVERCLREYDDIGVWTRSEGEGGGVTFVGAAEAEDN